MSEIGCSIVNDRDDEGIEVIGGAEEIRGIQSIAKTNITPHNGLK